MPWCPARDLARNPQISTRQSRLFEEFFLKFATSRYQLYSPPQGQNNSYHDHMSRACFFPPDSARSRWGHKRKTGHFGDGGCGRPAKPARKPLWPWIQARDVLVQVRFSTSWQVRTQTAAGQEHKCVFEATAPRDNSRLHNAANANSFGNY